MSNLDWVYQEVSLCDLFSIVFLVSFEFAGLGVSFCLFSSFPSQSVSCTGSLTRCLRFQRYDPSEVSTTCDRGAVSSTTIPEVSWSRIHTASPGSNKGSSLALCRWSWLRLCLSIRRVVRMFLLMSSWAGLNPHSSGVLRYARNAR